MALTLRYSLQHSAIKPRGVTGEYCRLQVDSRPQQNKITITESDYQSLIEALTEGRLIGLQSESGVNLGQFMTSISGGILTKEFVSPSKNDVKISFRPTQQFLRDVRELVSFEQIPTVKNNPSIRGFTFTDNMGNVSTNEIPINTNGLLHITGINFIKGGMQVIITQSDSMAKVKLNTQIGSGTKFINMLVSNIDIDKANGFSVGTGSLIIKRNDNPQRGDEYEFSIV